MQGHLQQRGPNTWRLIVYAGRDADGKKRYLRETFHGGKRAAQDRLAQLIVDSGLGSYTVTDATVRDLASRWLTIATPSLSPTTLVGYRRIVNTIIIPRLGAMKLRALRASHIDSLYADLLAKPLSAQSVHHVHAVLRRMLNQGVRWGWLTVNPALNASPPKVRRRELTIPDVDEVLRIIAEAERRDPDYAALLRVAAATGARRGELCALRWSGVDLVGSTITFARAIVGERNDSLLDKETKTSGVRRISIDPDTVDVLARHRDRCDERASAAGAGITDSAYVFSPAVDGSRPWRPGALSLYFTRLRNRVGLKGFGIHSLRHVAATQMLAAGVPVKTVAGRLGHANAAITLNVYAAFLASSDQEAANVMGDVLRGSRGARKDSRETVREAG